MSDATRALLKNAFDQYLTVLATVDLLPACNYLPYDLLELEGYRWGPLGLPFVRDDLQEVINLLNQWQSYLLRWDAWNRVLQPYPEEDAWEIRREFLESMVHYCLLQPSSMRDTLTFFATNAVHQVRLASESSYADRLPGDATSVDPNPRPPSRRQKEKALSSVLSAWPEGASLLSALQCLDGPQYRKVTSDYRNRTSHSIGPRLGFGTTRTVTRSLVPAEEVISRPDGSLEPRRVPGRLWVSYGYGGTDPLDFVASLVFNREQYDLTRSCYSELRTLLRCRLASVPKSTKGTDA